MLLLCFCIEVGTSLKIKRSAKRHFTFFIKFLRNFRIIQFPENPCTLPCSPLACSIYISVSPPNFIKLKKKKPIYCLFFLAYSHFQFFIISSLWSSVSFFFFFPLSVMAALPVVLLWGPEFPLANETRAAYLPCFCNPAVSFLKYKLIFIQWSSCAGSDHLRGDCILWQWEGGEKINFAAGKALWVGIQPGCS